MSIPMKVIPDTAVDESWTTSEERMKELFSHAWDAVKRLTVQLAHKFTNMDAILPFTRGNRDPAAHHSTCGNKIY
ncbi:hypothetical protein CHARACLAT_028347 [Characodon lateralis]|uniref:Uncharacterized protein n=1 Tax=Characodon lateralis TaxID=208331 RepID=A0ABU7DMM6_9TELE|nr:hypothetical protein [Characodon lateralis]